MLCIFSDLKYCKENKFIFTLSKTTIKCLHAFRKNEHRSKGESYTIRCPAPQKDAVGVYLNTRREVQRQVLYYSIETGDVTVHTDYSGRVNISRDEMIVTSNIWNLQLNDAGAYWCSCIKHFEKCEMTADKGVILLINVPSGEVSSSTAKQHNGMSDFLIPVTTLTACSVLLLLLLLFGVWLVPKIKKTRRMINREEKTSGNGVYEVMNVHR
ncbi:hypothetical protein IRJ41_014072 [Triplophysa rosa]|uniref:Immunoglobulin V-set domain-containing protein n=1 Tax=Triplophysa rosa TaxID=992332 RepID=A0A9W7TWY3_TRIRA|nr:hypothetical protein IRJ41_014072 [Triplophysa rosa]